MAKTGDQTTEISLSNTTVNNKIELSLQQYKQDIKVQRAKMPRNKFTKMILGNNNMKLSNDFKSQSTLSGEVIEYDLKNNKIVSTSKQI